MVSAPKCLPSSDGLRKRRDKEDNRQHDKKDGKPEATAA